MQRRYTSTAWAVAAFTSATANAQQSQPLAPEASQGEEIIVTGTKRTTTLQDSDISVTVLDKETIEQARVRDFRRIDDLAPNVQFNESGQIGSVFITIRGVESNPFIVNRSAVYIDGIPFRELSNAVLNQIESIEVLRGPQATLYGANSESGLILISTRAPTDRPVAELRLTGTTFSQGQGVTADGFIGGPIVSDTLAGSIAFKTLYEDSFLRNLADNQGGPGEVRQGFVQGRLRWTPDSRLTVNATAYWLKERAPGLFSQNYLPLDVDFYNASYADALNGGRRAGKFTYFNDAPKLTTDRELVAGASATWTLDYGQIDVAGSYRNKKENARGLDFDFTALPTAAGSEVKDESFGYAEARFSSPASRPFSFIVGGSYYDENLRRTLATFVGPGRFADYVPAPRQQSVGHDIGAFASASYTPPALAAFTLSAGLRYDRAYRRTRQQEGTLDLGPSGSIFYQNIELDQTFDALLPRVALRWEPSENLTLFASAARGYIPGGFNLTAAQEGFLQDDVLRYDSETLWSREIGFKARTADRRGRFAGAVFYITSDNWQEIRILTDAQGRPISSDFIGSTASIRNIGFELEASYDLPSGLQLAANFGLTDAEYRDFPVSPGVNRAGNRVKLVPRYDGYVSARYALGGGFFVRGELGLIGSTPLDEREFAIQKAVQTYGLQAGWEGERFSARLFAENLSNVRRASGLAFDNLAFGADGNSYSPIDAPRIVGLELESRF